MAYRGDQWAATVLGITEECSFLFIGCETVWRVSDGEHGSGRRFSVARFGTSAVVTVTR